MSIWIRSGLHAANFTEMFAFRFYHEVLCAVFFTNIRFRARSLNSTFSVPCNQLRCNRTMGDKSLSLNDCILVEPQIILTSSAVASWGWPPRQLPRPPGCIAATSSIYWEKTFKSETKIMFFFTINNLREVNRPHHSGRTPGAWTAIRRSFLLSHLDVRYPTHYCGPLTAFHPLRLGNSLPFSSTSLIFLLMATGIPIEPL